MKASLPQGKTIENSKNHLKIQNRDRIYFSVREITLLNELKHPNIVELMAICPEKEKLYLIFEFMSMDLKQYLDITKSQYFIIP